MIEKEINLSCGVSGLAVCRFLDGKEDATDNALTNFGMLYIMRALIDLAMPQLFFAVGDDDSSSTPAEIALQNVLKSELQRLEPIQDYVTQSYEGDYIYRMLSDFSDGTLDGDTIREKGLFCRGRKSDGLEAEDSCMIARSKTEFGFNMDSNSVYQGQWDIKFSACLGGIVAGGQKIMAQSILREDNTLEGAKNYPYGINLVSLGTGTTAFSSADLDLETVIAGADTPPTITLVSTTDIDTDSEYKPVLKIQKYIPASSVSSAISEVGLFRSRKEKPISTGVTAVDRLLFSRTVFDTPIPSNAEATITFNITLERV